MPEKLTIEELEHELEGLRKEKAAQEADRRKIDLANEIAEKLQPLEFHSRMYVLRIVVAMANNTWNREVSLTVAKS